MKNILIILVLIFLTLPQWAYGQQEVNVTLEKTLEIKGGDEFFLVDGIDMQATDQYIFVEQPTLRKIKVFSKQGEYFRSFGGQGKGPGEFSRMTAMWTDQNGHVYVADYINARISQFNAEGKMLNDFLINNKKMQWPRSFHQVNKDEYLVLYLRLKTEKEVFHLWDDKFQVLKKSFDLPPGYINDDPVKKADVGFHVGSCVIEDSTVIYVPHFYEGTIYSRNIFTDDSWQSHQGKNIELAPFEILESGNIRNEKIKEISDQRMFTPEGNFALRLNSTSKGMFKTKEGYIINFIEIRNSNWKEQGMEVYDQDLNFITYKRYARRKIKPNDKTLIHLYPNTIDKNNKLYRANYRKQKPHIEIFQLNIEK